MMRTALRLLALVATMVVESPCGAQPSGYPSVVQAGFHHCALIYHKDQRGPAELLPFVARRDGDRYREWLFDAYLFLDYNTPSGKDTLDGASVQRDWQWQIDNWFAPGRDLAALDQATDDAARDLGKPPAPRQVMLAIPYLNPLVHDFGDVNGDGVTEDLATPEGRKTVLAWYLGEARRRFREAGYRNLRLWGFYWMREDMPAADEATVRETANLVHAGGERFLWIPWFRAAGWDRWQQVQFDVALMQPGYAFTFAHHGTVRRNRLAVTAGLAKQNGLGVEMECGDVTTEADDRRYFLRYLADGSAERLGYQQAATAYYLGDDTVEQMLASRDSQIRHLYDTLADYVAGRTVPEPDSPVAWNARPSGAALGGDYLALGRPLQEAETTVEPPRVLRDVWLTLDEPASRAGQSFSVQVDVRPSAHDPWTPAGWAVRCQPDPDSGMWPAVTVPVGRRASAVRVRIKPTGGKAAPLVRSIALEDGDAAEPAKNRAIGCPYRFTPSIPGLYADTGHFLTDGVVPDKGFAEHRSVGWMQREAQIRFDLGSVQRVTSVEVCCQGGGTGAVNWPAWAVAACSAYAPPPLGPSGTGVLPDRVRWINPGPVIIDRQRAPDDMDGHITFTPQHSEDTRYISISMGASGWLMVNEVRIFVDGVNIAPKATYTLRPAPSGSAKPGAYPDDGVRLTDGHIAQNFDAGAVTGWETEDEGVAVIDLVTPTRVSAVTTWSLRGGMHGIYAPASVTVEVSHDGVTWSAVGSVSKAASAETGSECVAVPYRVVAPTAPEARYVRVRVKRSRGWVMLSEIEVEPR